MSLRPTQRNSDTLPFILFVWLSVALHLPALMLLSLWEAPVAGDLRVSGAAGKNPSKQFSVKVVTEKPEKKKEEKPREDELDENLQFVSAPLPEVEEIPDKARFLDRVASKAERETVNKAPPGAPKLPTSEPAPKERSRDKSEAAQTAPPQRDETFSKGSLEKMDKGGEAARQMATDLPMRPNAQEKSGGGAESVRVALPNFANTPLISPNGDNGTIDYLRDVEEGDKTLLNRKESRYAAFFDRVKIQIADKWSPATTYRKRDPRGNIFGVKDRYSQVRVTLNGDGSVRQLFLARESGLDFFDDEAVRSIRAAAPFHNPPEGLKDDDGLVHFTFGFYFEISAGTGLRVFR